MSEEATLDTGSQEVAASVATSEGVAATTWLDSLEPTYRENPLVNRFQDANEFAKSYVSAQKIIGAEKVAKPSKSWSDDQYNEFYAAIGRPESPDLYQLTDAKYDDNQLASLRQMAFEAGLQPRQFEKIAGFMRQANEQGAVEQDALYEQKAFEARQALRQEYGQAMEQKLNLAINTAKQYVGVDNMEIFNSPLPDGSLLGDHPAIVKMFVNIAESIGEDNIVGEPTEMIMTPQEAKRQIDDLMRPGTALTIGDHPDHDAAVAEVLRLRSFL